MLANCGRGSIHRDDGLIGEATHGLSMCPGVLDPLSPKMPSLSGLSGKEGLWLLAWPGKHVWRSSLQMGCVSHEALSGLTCGNVLFSLIFHPRNKAKFPLSYLK